MENESRRGKTFDIICAGEALFRLVSPRHSRHALHAPATPLLAPAGGAVNIALTLATSGLRVGLATVLDDDDFGRRLVEQIAVTGVDTGGVLLARTRAQLLRIDASGGANVLPSHENEREPLAVPRGWAAPILLLSGLSPVVSHAAALCKAARAARREGTLVVLDFNASLHAWNGRDPRTIKMVLREIDVARCSIADLAVVGMDVATVRASLRPTATLVVSDAYGGSVATGAFGEVAYVPSDVTKPRENGSGDALTAHLCKALLRRGEAGESASASWYRAINPRSYSPRR